MTFTDRLFRANHWYDRLSPREGGLVAIWACLGLFGAAVLVNFYLGLTLWALLLLGFGGLVAARLAYRLGKLDPADGVLPAETEATVRLPYAEKLLGLNQWFDAQTPLARMCTTMGWLYGSFALNLMLTHRIGLPFAVLFVGVAGVMLIARLGYAHGWLGGDAQAIPAPDARPAIAPPSPIGHPAPVMLATVAQPVAERAEVRA